jgi:hypothetical protein
MLTFPIDRVCVPCGVSGWHSRCSAEATGGPACRCESDGHTHEPSGPAAKELRRRPDDAEAAWLRQYRAGEVGRVNGHPKMPMQVSRVKPKGQLS